MLYLAMTFWLLIIVLLAGGVHSLWSGLVKPRTVNSVLLPGTLVAQLGHVLGLLVTGATVTNTTLYKDDESGAPEMTKDAKPKIPVLGPIVIGMLPLLACAIAIWFLADQLGGPLFKEMSQVTVARELPKTLTGVWESLRQAITLAETVLAAVLDSNLQNLEVWLFIYLLVCLTVRMAPFPGNARGTLGAVVMLGLLLGLAGMAFEQTQNLVQDAWPVLSATVGSLLVLLLASLLVRGVVKGIKLLGSGSGGKS